MMSIGGNLGFPHLEAIRKHGSSRLRAAKERTAGNGDLYLPRGVCSKFTPDVGGVIVIYTFYAP